MNNTTKIFHLTDEKCHGTQHRFPCKFHVTYKSWVEYRTIFDTTTFNTTTNQKNTTTNCLMLWSIAGRVNKNHSESWLDIFIAISTVCPEKNSLFYFIGVLWSIFYDFQCNMINEIVLRMHLSTINKLFVFNMQASE